MFNLSSNFQGKSKDGQKEQQWRLFHAKDFQSLMYPCFTFCHILGIFPYKIDASTFKASKPHYILLTVITCVCVIYTLITLFGYSLRGEISMIQVPWILVNSCNFVFGTFIIIVMFILSGPRMRLLQTISTLSSRLSSETYQKLSMLIHAKDIFGFLYLVGHAFLCVYILDLNLGFQLYLYLVVFQMDMLYMNCICVLKICFKRINDNLVHMQELVTNNDPYDSRLIHQPRNLFLIMELRAMKKEHLMISETVKMLNMIFSLHLLATLIIVFFDITVYLFYYEYIFHWPHNKMNTLEKILNGIYIFYCVVYNSTRTILIVWACETGKDQALQISTSIHDVFNNCTDKQIKNELQIFSLQTLHCENIFSTKGLTVNAKLLTKIVGSIATYILILFQFMRMSYSCERMTNNITKI
ncbi:PREDICTED: uncharacterized protein LOC105568933 [Vollenhovia emeryi]|uniref:uncharacterized protein LOC105568933 n=1 Tax=Vollenhovia emeryi TaxID=411798 RepID=UPI0005F4A745|nr:PREDICTED: uncharacterized protein LOC105568933 [Vollenhovia emeryi]